MFNTQEYYEARFLPFEAERVMLILRNVSERKKVESQLRQKIEYLP
jgi:hypothetical protein